MNLKTASELARQNLPEAAWRIYEDLLKKSPKNPLVLADSVAFLNRYGRDFRAAVPLVLNLIKLKPRSDLAHRLAAETFANCVKFQAAAFHAEKAMALNPKDAENYSVATYIYTNTGAIDRASKLIEKAIKLAPKNVLCLLQKGRLAQSLGQMDLAVALAKQVLEIAPGNVNALDLYVTCAPISVDDPILDYMKTTLLPKFGNAKTESLANLYEIIGAAELKAEMHTEGFQSFTKAKSTFSVDHDPKVITAYGNAIVAEIRPSHFRPQPNLTTATPVLIVGMPRTGSTLLEQMLAAHPGVTTVGESPALRHLAMDVGIEKHGSKALIRAVKEMPVDGAAHLANTYIKEAHVPPAPGKMVIDKSLHNFELLGFFSRLFPQAPIIWTLRDPLDTCVSCYLQSLSKWHTYTRDLTSLGQAYLDHLALLHHWRKVLPNPVEVVQYEALIKDSESVCRSALRVLNLDWDEACLDYRSAQTPSRTLSNAQVRKPLYTSSQQRWRRFEPQLGPLKETLKGLYPNGFDAPAVFDLG